MQIEIFSPLIIALLNMRMHLMASPLFQKRTKPNLDELLLDLLKGIYESLTLPALLKIPLSPCLSKSCGKLLMKTENSCCSLHSILLRELALSLLHFLMRFVFCGSGYWIVLRHCSLWVIYIFYSTIFLNMWESI